MKIAIAAAIGAFACLGASPAMAQGTPIGCTSFSGFPLSIALGARVGNVIVGSESAQCANAKIMTAVNNMAGMRGAPNGIATLGANGYLPLAQFPPANLISPIPSGRKAVEQGDGSDLSAIPAASGVSVTLANLFAAMRPQAATNAALKTSGTWFTSIRRNGFYAQGDGGVMDYTWSGANCAAADDGYQVQPTGRTGCWVADLGEKLKPEAWGAQANGTFDDGPAVRAACNVGATFGRAVLISRIYYMLSLDPRGNGALEMGSSATGATNPSCDLTGSRRVQHPDMANVVGVGLALGPNLNRPLVYAYPNTRSPHVTNVYLFGSKNTQTGYPGGPLNTGGTGGKLCTVVLADSAGGFVESGMTLDAVIIRDGYNCNFYQGGNRGTVFTRDMWSQYSGQPKVAGSDPDFSIYWVGFDSHTSNMQLGSNVGGGQWVRDGGQHMQEGTTAFLNGAAATRISGGKVAYFTQTGGNVAANFQTGIEVVPGAPYSGQGYGGYVFTNVTFDCNSGSGNGGFPDVSADTMQGLVLNSPVFVGCVTSSSPIPNYNVQSLNGAYITVSSPTFGNVAANTLGFTNNCAFIQGNFPVTCKWTPVLAGDTTAGTPTYTRQFGTFTRFGNTETVSFALDTSALGGPAGNLVIKGLPLFSGANANDSGTCSLSQWGGWTAPTGRVALGGFVSATATTVSLFTNGSDGSGIAPAAVSQFAAATRLWGTCTYRVSN